MIQYDSNTSFKLRQSSSMNWPSYIQTISECNETYTVILLWMHQNSNLQVIVLSYNIFFHNISGRSSFLSHHIYQYLYSSLVAFLTILKSLRILLKDWTKLHRLFFNYSETMNNIPTNQSPGTKFKEKNRLYLQKHQNIVGGIRWIHITHSFTQSLKLHN